MVFQSEDVPLTEDIIKKDVEFVKSWKEWATDRIERVSRMHTKFGTGHFVLYTVPKDKFLYITNTMLSIACAASTNARMTFSPSSLGFVEGTDMRIMMLRCKANNSNASSFNFAMPFKVEEGMEIRIGGVGINDTVTGGFIGFLLDRKLI